MPLSSSSKWQVSLKVKSVIEANKTRKVSNMFDTFLVLFYHIGVKGFLHLMNMAVTCRMENRIKEYREKRSLSQGKLAELCSVSRQTINAIENNKYDPSLQLAFDIVRHLESTMEDLFIPSKNEGKKS
jgi:putative transcriptional regulator